MSTPEWNFARLVNGSRRTPKALPTVARLVTAGFCSYFESVETLSAGIEID
jgi:hypothetical protein